MVYQVTSATYGNSQSDNYAYDPMGNRTSASIASQGAGSTTYTANNANQYTSITGLTPISHDANGNLLQQNNVTYVWDSENRLLSVTPNIPTLGDSSLVHTYDGQHRRVTRSIREWTAGGWAITETLHFVYDGWNVIEEYALNASSSTLIRNLTWGQDLGGSATLQAAGGVGGLLMVEEITGSTTTAYHFHYDGNGNVTEITDLSGNSAASYRYDAFGNTLVFTGPYAAENRYRFSTKPLDHEVTDAPLYYYGYRYYDPLTGRWPSRDPIEEKGGLNLYCFVDNNGINRIDILGQKSALDCLGKIKDILDGNYQSTDVGKNQDKQNHCVASCELSNECGEIVAALLGGIKEQPDIMMDVVGSIIGTVSPAIQNLIREITKHNSVKDSIDDMIADAEGLSCADSRTQTCDCCCLGRGVSN
ncbi:MAG: RHS repeat-associated core domain-containing protein [Akkermansiaceae bacterium]